MKLVDLNARLRRVMVEFDSAAFFVQGSFIEVGGATLERAAEEARLALVPAADALERFLAALEKTPAYQAEVSKKGNSHG